MNQILSRFIGPRLGLGKFSEAGHLGVPPPKLEAFFEAGHLGFLPWLICFKMRLKITTSVNLFWEVVFFTVSVNRK